MSLQREINIIAEPTSDRNSKKLALNKLLKEASNPSLNTRELASFYEMISQHLLLLMIDPIEKCRELSVEIIMSVVTRVDDVHTLLIDLLPTFVNRLGQNQLIESSEVSQTKKEIRLQMIKILVIVTKRSEIKYAPFTEDTMKILVRSLVDPYPDIRKESCLLVIELCNQIPAAISQLGDSLAKAVLPNLRHKHSGVRIIALKAVAKALIIDGSAIDDCVSVIYPLILDRSHSVRSQLYESAYILLAKLLDRHVYAYKILPIMYAGLVDEMPKLQADCEAHIIEIGTQYERENTNKIKDELDYSDGRDYSGRPGVGCRHHARDNAQKLLKKLLDDLGDWNLDLRYRSAQILTVFMKFLEDNVTGYTASIFPTVFKVLVNDEKHVMEQTISFMEEVGKYINLNTATAIIFPALKGGAEGASAFRMGCLRAFQGICRGTSSSQINEHLGEILQNITDKELINNDNMLILREISECLIILAGKLNNGNPNHFEFFFALSQLLSIQGDPKTPGYVDMRQNTINAISKQSEILGISSVEIYQRFLAKSLLLLSSTYKDWNIYSIERHVLETVVLNSGTNYIHHLSILMPILIHCSNGEQDFAVRQGIFTMINKMLSMSLEPTNLLELQNNLVPFVEQILLSTCKWRAGKKAITLRGLAVSAFLRLMEMYDSSIFLDYFLNSFEKEVFPVLLSNLDDDLLTTRSNVLQLLSICLEIPCWNDDAKDEIRIQTCKIFEIYFGTILKWQNNLVPLIASLSESEKLLTAVKGPNDELIEIRLDSVHFDAMVNGLIVHLDDNNPLVQVY